jgi:hypothetical protein
VTYKQKEESVLKNQAVTTRLDLSLADAAQHSEAMSGFEKRLQVTEDGV